MVTSFPLSAVSGLLSEFHSPNTDNIRKHEIEKQLSAFQQDSNSWPQCLQALSNFHENKEPKLANQLVWVFTVSTIEVAIRKKWKRLSQTDQNQLRDNLWKTYTTLQLSDTIRYHREKISQLIALIGKRQYPDEHRMYMCHIMELMQRNFLLGIILLRTTFEESMDTRDTITTDQRKYFHSNLTVCMPQIFHLVTQYLVIHVCALKRLNLDTMPRDFVNEQLINALPKDGNLSYSAKVLLATVQTLLSWAPLNETLHEQFLICLFELASWNDDENNVPTNALTAITEILYKQQMLPFPNIFLEGIQNIIKQPQLSSADDMYQDKLTELVRLFTAQQWSRLASNEQVFTDYIGTISSFTFEGYNHFAFSEKLSIWHPIINGLGPRRFGQHANTMHILVAEILRKIQTRHDPDLNDIDNDILDDDMQTDWQQFLTQCIETIALVAEYQPQPVFEQVYMEWQKQFELFDDLGKTMNGTFVVTDSQQNDMIYSVLRDLATMCQTLTRILTSKQGCGQEASKNISHITYCLLNAIKFIAANKLHSVNCNGFTLSLVAGFAETLAQLLNSVRNLLPWSPIVQNENELKSLIEYVAQTLLPPSNVVQEFNPRLMTLSASQFLLTVSSNIRPRYLLDCPSFKQLIQQGVQLNHLDDLATKTVRNAIVNSFVLPWPNVPNADQVFDRRANMLEEYINNLSENLLNVDHSAAVSSQHDKIIRVLTVVLPALRDILDYHCLSATSVKLMLMHSYKSSIEKSLIIYNVFGATNEQIASGILQFIISVLQTLQIQLGSHYTKEMLDSIIKTSMCEQLTVNRLKTMDKVILMLLLIVRQPGSIGVQLLPSILPFALNYVMPLLMQTQNASDFCDVVMSLFQLFDGILQHRWTYFYKSQVSRGFSPCSSNQINENQPQHLEELIAIFTAYGHGIQQTINPQITGIILISLESLHEHWSIYDREFFKTNLLSAFMDALLKLATSSSGILFYEQAVKMLFSMNQACWQVLHTILAQYYKNAGHDTAPKIIDEICTAKDFPTFEMKMAQFSQDVKSFELP